MYIEKTINRIRSFRKSMEWSVNKLTRKAGLLPGVLRHMDNDNWNPQAETLKAIEVVIPKDFEVMQEAKK